MPSSSEFPFPFFGHTFPEPGADIHAWALRFEKTPARGQRPAIARPLVEALTRGIFLQREEAPWRWSKEWLIVTADEHAGAPDVASEARMEALASVEQALTAVHAIAPLAEVLFGAYQTPSGSPWDHWSRGSGRMPSVRGAAIFRKGAADKAVESLRLTDPGLEASVVESSVVDSTAVESVESGAAAALAVTEVDKKLVPSAKLLPPVAARVAELEAQQSRGDRIYGVSDTPTGQAVWLMASVGQSARNELCVSSGTSYVAMPVHSASRQDHDRARVEGDADGWLLVTDVLRETVLELQPSTGASRLVCDVPCGTTGPIEAVRVEQGIIVSTTHGLFLVARAETHAAVPVAFLPRRGFRHIAPVPSRRGVVSCEFGGGEGSVAVMSADVPLEVIREITVKPAVTEPVLHAGRVIARQGRSWREIVGVHLPQRPGGARERLTTEAEARLARGEAALVPTDDALLSPLRFHGGRRVVASCRARGAEVLIVDGSEQREIVVLRDDGAEQRVAIERWTQPSTLETSPDGRRVLVAGRRFLHAELHVDDAVLRPIGDPMRRSAPHRGINVACYIGDDRLLFPSSGQLRVQDLGGATLACVPTEFHEWPNLAVARAHRDVLFRNGAGEAIFVHTREGEIVSHTRVGTHVAHVFARDEQLYATCHGVTCRLEESSLG